MLLRRRGGKGLIEQQQLASRQHRARLWPGLLCTAAPGSVGEHNSNNNQHRGAAAAVPEDATRQQTAALNGDSPLLRTAVADAADASNNGAHHTAAATDGIDCPKVTSKIAAAAARDAKEDNGEDRLFHSNREIQVLLDRYHRLCQEQLPEQGVEAAAATATPVLDKHDRRGPSRAVFSNNLVDLSRVEVVGFDYDYTLATCKSYSNSSQFLYRTKQQQSSKKHVGVLLTPSPDIISGDTGQHVNL